MRKSLSVTLVLAQALITVFSLGAQAQNFLADLDDLPVRQRWKANSDVPFYPVTDAAPLTVRTSEDQCRPVDLRKVYPKILGAKTVRNQASYGYCFAFAMSDVLSVVAGERLSSLDGAVLQYQYTRAHGIESGANYVVRPEISTYSQQSGGSPLDVLRAALRSNGLCREADFPARLEFVDLERYWKGQHGTNAYSEIHSDRDFAAALSKQFPYVSAADAHSFMQRSSSSSDLIDYLEVDNCEGRRVNLPDLGMVSVTWHPQNDASEIRNGGVVLRELDNALDNGKPVALGYDAYRALRAKSTQSGPHESVIVGRKFAQGSCHYLVRNSWGEQCSAEAGSRAICDREQPGNFWISESNLLLVGDSISYVLPKQDVAALKQKSGAGNVVAPVVAPRPRNMNGKR